MKNLVLGALLVAAASSAACTSDVTVTASWSFRNITTGEPRSCPIGFNTATVIAEPFDPLTAEVNGGLITADLFDCAALQGTILVPDGVYLMSVRIQTDSGSETYADSEQVLIDTATDAAFDVEILDDGGYFYFTWELQDAASLLPLTCAEAGVTANGSVEAVSTLTTDSSSIVADKFTCEDHFGTTAGLRAGVYTVSIDAEDNDLALGEPVNLANREIRAPNGTTDLGHIMIPID